MIFKTWRNFKVLHSERVWYGSRDCFFDEAEVKVANAALHSYELKWFMLLYSSPEVFLLAQMFGAAPPAPVRKLWVEP